MAAIAAHAAWHMGDWDSMAVYTATLKDAADAPAARLSAEFLSGVLHAHNQDWASAAGPPLPPPPLPLSRCPFFIPFSITHPVDHLSRVLMEIHGWQTGRRRCGPRAADPLPDMHLS